MWGTAAMLFAAAVQATGVPGQGTWESTLKGRDISGTPVAASSSSAVFLYDTVLDITWLRDANVNGAQDWTTAKSWADTLVVGAYGGWRLPTMIDTGAIGCGEFTYDGSTDCGFNVPTRSGGITYSEMAHLWYVTLGNKAYCDTAGSCPQPGWGLTNTGDFEHFQSYWYWSDVFSPISNGWSFNFDQGFQVTEGAWYGFYALAVRPGDVAAVPEPTTYALLLLGLAVLAVRQRRRR